MRAEGYESQQRMNTEPKVEPARGVTLYDNEILSYS